VLGSTSASLVPGSGRYAHSCSLLGAVTDVGSGWSAGQVMPQPSLLWRNCSVWVAHSRSDPGRSGRVTDAKAPRWQSVTKHWLDSVIASRFPSVPDRPPMLEVATEHRPTYPTAVLGQETRLTRQERFIET